MAKIETEVKLQKHGTDAKSQKKLYELKIVIVGTISALSEEVIDHELARVSTQVIGELPYLNDY